MRVLVTGGLGFIGTALCRHLLFNERHEVLNVDKITYVANLRSHEHMKACPGYRFARADVCDRPTLESLLGEFAPDTIFHLAAETHVDRSISGSEEFIRTNVVGTHVLLEVARAYWARLPEQSRGLFRFIHVSTDEVYGSLGPTGFFVEDTAYDPRSPYSASKAASDHLVSAWHSTYGLPTIIANCGNNYGPYQFPEKLIPLMILNALEDKPLPVYGDGRNLRDWIHVEDHTRALALLLTEGRIGHRYNIGARNERTNLEVVQAICDILDELAPSDVPRHKLIRFVTDRPGHDRRYSIDPSKLESELGWRPRVTFESGLRDTVRWYLGNRDWWRPLRDEIYGGDRIGLIDA
jgi:dTDP-glucose 4,6-dehydratase